MVKEPISIFKNNFDDFQESQFPCYFEFVELEAGFIKQIDVNILYWRNSSTIAGKGCYKPLTPSYTLLKTDLWEKQ